MAILILLLGETPCMPRILEGRICSPNSPTREVFLKNARLSTFACIKISRWDHHIQKFRICLSEFNSERFCNLKKRRKLSAMASENNSETCRTCCGTRWENTGSTKIRIQGRYPRWICPRRAVRLVFSPVLNGRPSIFLRETSS